MPISNKIAEGVDEVDVIIAGGGAAGCIVAGRVAAADPELSVLLVEGGENNYNMENVVHPALFREHLLPGSKTAIFYQGNKSEALAGRAPIVPAGGLLGGGSSVNLMLYTRAQRSDFDSFNMPGWSAKEIIPFLKKLETYHGPGDAATHGYEGPIHISDGGYRETASEADFIRGMEKCGYPEYKDLQDLDSNNGCARWLRNVSPEGKRQDSAHVYVHPLLQSGDYPNFHVLCESKVEKVLFDDDKRACGIEYGPNPQYLPAQSHTEGDNLRKSVKARKMVVISCGACHTPSVLERSGIGSKEILQSAGVDVVEDLPGVGSDYQDHNLIFYPFRTSLEPHQTMDAILSGRHPRDVAIAKRDPILRWNTSDVSAKMRPTEEEVVALGPDFKAAWDKDFAKDPNRPLMLMSLVSSFLGDQSTVDPGQYVSVAAFTAYPYSRGSVHIKGPNWSDGVSFDVGFISDPHDIDLKKQLWAYKKLREVMRRTEMYRGELQIGHPVFPEGSPAACLDLSSQGALGENVKDVEYSKEDDEAIIKFLREHIETTWHSLGTAKMAPRKEMGVVDHELNVYGVKGLKCCDMSIIPQNVAANTCNTAFVTGEMGAHFILKDLGLTEKPIPKMDMSEFAGGPPKRADSALSYRSG